MMLYKIGFSEGSLVSIIQIFTNLTFLRLHYSFLLLELCPVFVTRESFLFKVQNYWSL